MDDQLADPVRRMAPVECDVLALAIAPPPLARPAVATVTTKEATNSIARRLAPSNESRYRMLSLHLSRRSRSPARCRLSGYAAQVIH
ncbi:MAG TPA: hypothetical protein VF979_01615, partial [Streptosporangiaceae bacterium]